MKTSPSVLVCEDDSFLRAMLSSHLRGEGFLIYEAENGFESLHCMLKEPPDVILLDMEMPKMDGFAFLENMKAARLNTPVFVLSGLLRSSLLSQLKKYDVQDVIQKPYSLKQISGILNRL
jgi:CheY-like chemotaxis protein